MKQNMKEAIGLSLKRYNETYMKPTNDRIDNIVAQAGTDNTEIVDARIDSAGVTHTTLNNRILAETKMNDEQLVTYTGNYISAEDTTQGYLKNIEILGNTIQDEEDLADIRSVGDKVEGQELYEIPVLSVGKNLINKKTLKEMLHTYIQGEEGSKIKLNYVSMTSNSFEVPLSLVGNYTISYQCKETVGGKNPKLGFRYSDGSASYNTSFVATSNYSTYKHFSNGKDVVGLCITYNNTGGDFWVDLDSIQLEEGTVATPYEPYQEDKLTILSPVQLEKVGDVADRIICKDGVWGIEKNIKTGVLNGSENWKLTSSQSMGATNLFMTSDITDIISASKVISNRFTYDINQYASDVESIKCYNNKNVNIRISKTKANDVSEFKNWLSNNIVLIKYILEQPQFIPLPHYQQVKLRTFANKTNISFLTEIEGTIKAQVPKSLGATVNTHTEQISNLNKELDRVKKLEESTVSTVETESDFTTVEATNNGYFEDVKLEGKTLVNKISNISLLTIGNEEEIHCNFDKICTDKPLTLINTTDKELRFEVRAKEGNTYIRDIGVMPFSCVLSSLDTTEALIKIKGLSRRGWNPTDQSHRDAIKKQIILEGDHTQNPPSYFEGLKSVGEGTDEIVVSSVNENLLDGDLLIYGMFNYDNGDVEVSTTTKHIAYPKLIKVEPNTTYYSYGNLKVVTFFRCK